MEEVRDINGRLISTADPIRGIIEYNGTGRVRITIRALPGCAIAIEKNDSATIIERPNNQSFLVNHVRITA